MEAYDTDKVVVLDQGSRPGRALVSSKEQEDKRVLIVDHHMSDDVSTLLLVSADLPVPSRLSSPHGMSDTTNSHSCASHLPDASTSTSCC